MQCHKVLTVAILAVSQGFGEVWADNEAAVEGGLEATPWINEGMLQGADAESGWAFGKSVAIGGDTAAVGAYNMVVDDVRTGGAYIFGRQGDSWVEEHKIEPEDGHEDDELGWSVAAEGDVALAGTRGALIGNQVNQGAVYAFVRIDGVWQQTQKLLASDGDEQDDFGVAMVLDGDTLVVGAQRKDVAGQEQGSAYVFVLEGGLWIEQAKLFDPDGQVSDGFGRTVALDGDTALIGAPVANVNGETNLGAAYVFERVGTTWTLQQRLLASDSAFNDQFGSSVALDGNIALIGATEKSINGMEFHGAAYFFERQNGIWTEAQRVLPSNGQEDGEFGASAALVGDLALIGGYEQPQQVGIAYEFRYDGSTWLETQQIIAPLGPGTFDGFAQAVAIDGGRAIFSQIGFDARGAAWVLRRPPLFEDGFESGDTSVWSAVVP